MTRSGLVLAATVLCIGCGQKGPLYLPDEDSTTPSVVAPASDAADNDDTDDDT